MQEIQEGLKKAKENVAIALDFPTKGIVFRDVAPVMRDNLADITKAFIQLTKDYIGDVSYVAGIESRGLVFASAFAQATERGLLMIRKKGKFPPPTVELEYQLEYGSAILEMQQGHGKILIIDDVLATGGSILAAKTLAEKAGYEVVDMLAVMNIPDLNNITNVKYLFDI